MSQQPIRSFQEWFSLLTQEYSNLVTYAQRATPTIGMCCAMLAHIFEFCSHRNRILFRDEETACAGERAREVMLEIIRGVQSKDLDRVSRLVRGMAMVHNIPPPSSRSREEPSSMMRVEQCVCRDPTDSDQPSIRLTRCVHELWKLVLRLVLQANGQLEEMRKLQSVRKERFEALKKRVFEFKELVRLVDAEQTRNDETIRQVFESSGMDFPAPVDFSIEFAENAILPSEASAFMTMKIDSNVLDLVFGDTQDILADNYNHALMELRMEEKPTFVSLIHDAASLSLPREVYAQVIAQPSSSRPTTSPAEVFVDEWFGRDPSVIDTICPESDRTALEESLLAGDFVMFRFLIAQGAHARTLTVYYAAVCPDISFMLYLVACGLNRDARLIHEQTALHVAIRAGNVVMAVALIANEYDVHAKDANGVSPQDLLSVSDDPILRCASLVRSSI